ncbi:hypothetical protein [Aquimarina algicola]|uniref:Uncharacterized protein n=1 Tax=Aquimarina algicola TaxID=2589995 RepID=A0A504JC71_9FLAO|nr:hypothetical protein [Aquimarina algicola]TPN84519.1 hypothetical protein FHK87_16435 [Aquimarina algicola]
MRLSFLNEEEQLHQISPTSWVEAIWYRVRLKETTYFPVKKSHTITYKIKVDCQKDVERPIYTYRLEKQDIKINNVQSNQVFDQINLRIAAIFNTLEYQTGHSAILERLLNFKEIKQKWEAEKKKLLAEFQGKAIQQYITLVDVSMTEELVSLRLKKDPFLMSYFGPYYTDISNSEQELIAKDYFAGHTIRYPLVQKQLQEIDTLLTLKGTGNGVITTTQQQALFDHLIKRGYLPEGTQNKKTVATLENKVVLDTLTGQIQHCVTKQALQIASQNVKTSITTIEKE